MKQADFFLKLTIHITAQSIVSFRWSTIPQKQFFVITVGQTKFQKSIHAVATSKVTFKVESSVIGTYSNPQYIFTGKKTKNVK